MRGISYTYVLYVLLFTYSLFRYLQAMAGDPDVDLTLLFRDSGAAAPKIDIAKVHLTALWVLYLFYVDTGKH